VPNGWIIKPFDCFGDKGISVLWPNNRGGAHIRTNDPQNSIEHNLLHDLAQALVCGAQPTESAQKAWKYFQSLLGPNDPAKSVSTDRPGLGQRKAADIGPTIGVLVQNQHGEVAAVTDLGRCTWLNQDVTALGYGESVPDDEYIRALQDAFDIIQADTNTEENYGSLCRIGSVLAKLQGTPAKAD
jgi:hypothetical protein